jgi:hypothetical protein
MLAFPTERRDTEKATKTARSVGNFLNVSPSQLMMRVSLMTVVNVMRNAAIFKLSLAGHAARIDVHTNWIPLMNMASCHLI